MEISIGSTYELNYFGSEVNEVEVLDISEPRYQLGQVVTFRIIGSQHLHVVGTDVDTSLVVFEHLVREQAAAYEEEQRRAFFESLGQAGLDMEGQ